MKICRFTGRCASQRLCCTCEQCDVPMDILGACDALQHPVI